jgi:hypothetical protein
MTAHHQRVITDLFSAPPMSRIKIEYVEGGWCCAYAWTGCELILGLGNTLPNALHALALQLAKTFGDEV